MMITEGIRKIGSRCSSFPITSTSSRNSSRLDLIRSVSFSSICTYHTSWTFLPSRDSVSKNWWRLFNPSIQKRGYCQGGTNTLKPFLNFKYYAENDEAMANVIRRREVQVDLKEIIQLYQSYNKKLTFIAKLRSEKNDIAKILQNMDMLSKDEQGKMIEKGKELREQIKVSEEELEIIHSQLITEGLKVPNLIHPDVPDDQPKLLKLVGKPPQFSFSPRDHLDLGSELDLFDFETASEVVGGKFYYSKNEVALLELALVNWTIHRLTQKGFTPILTPDVVHTRYAEACGFRPRSPAGQMYRVPDYDMCLVGTSEIPLAALYHSKLFRPAEKEVEKFPIKMVAFGHCFRAEAGHRGRLSRGLYRVHQFSKVEMFVITTAEKSDEWHHTLLEYQMDILNSIGLHYRVLDMPANDLGASAYRKFDIETWFPSHNDYGEVTSCSNCTDYQSRRLNIRIKHKSKFQDSETEQLPSTNSTTHSPQHQPKKPKAADDKSEFVHTLNGTALAVPRIVMAILENYQTADGRVKIPDVLLPYMNGIDWIERRKSE